jgi:hypothetical protein
MRNLVSKMTLAGLMFVAPFAYSGETYESEEAKFKITFPTEFEVEKEVDEDGITTFSLSCTYGDMILIGNAYIYTEAVSEDDNMISEIEAAIRVAEAFGSKFNGKKVSLWTVAEDMGMINPLKTGGELKGYVGNYYIIIQGVYQWQFVVLGSKKTFDYGVESRFINSFEILP